MSPERIAHYRIAGKIGEGGMGAVYRATDTRLHRDVAIKVLPDAFARDPDRLARFTREAQVLAGLNHPNIATIYGVEERALILELVEGPTLADRIAQGPIPLEEALLIARQIAEALEYAHEKGVIHRDLKPANIKITPEGRVKVLDFGLAKALSTETAGGDKSSSPTMTMRATATGVILGTAAYMSPEQARGKPVDRRADIWAFGVVLFEMLTGRALFDGDTVSDLIAQVLTKEPALDSVPEGLRPLLRLCLERDARKRLRDIGDAFYLIGEKPPAASPPPAPRRRILPWILAAAATLAACAFAALWLRTSTAPPPLYRFAMDPNGPIRFSPNGRWMLNISNGLRVRSLDGTNWKSLPGTDVASDAFWSPDSSTIGFFSGGRLRAISLDGSNPRNLAPAPQPNGGSWRGGIADGIILFAASRQLQTLDLRSGNVAPLPLRFRETQTPVMPVFCPRGDGFVYLVRSANAAVTLFRSTLSAPGPNGERVLDTTFVVSFARHPRTGRWQIFYVRTDAGPGVTNRNLLTAPIDPRTGALSGEPIHVVDAVANWTGSQYARFDVADSGLIYWYRTTPSLPIWRLQWFDRNGNVVGTIGDAAGHTSISLSPDETRLASLVGYPDQHIWIYNLKNGTGARAASLPGSEGNPVWSPDSRFLYYNSETESGTRIMRQSVSAGSLPETLWQSPEGRRVSVQDVTPDGRYLILHLSNLVGFLTQSIGLTFFRLDLTAPLETRQPEPLFPATPGLASPINARISPDGRSMIFNDGNLIYACRYPTAGASPRQIAAFQNQVFPFFSRDGRLLYFVSDHALYSHSVINVPGGGIRLGERSLLFKLAHPARQDSNPAAASRDGNRILAIATENPDEAKIQILSDWTSLLPR